MKRILLACLGMALLGAAGLIILHQVFDAPVPIRAEPAGGPVVIPGGGRPPVEPGRYKDLVPALLGALADADGGVRQLAAASLVKIGADAVPPLTEALKTAKDKETRANAAYVLGHLAEQAQEALPVLAKALKDEDKEVRRRAAYAIHQIIAGSEGGASPNGLAAAPGAGGPPGGMAMMGAGPLLPATLAPSDPGLLVPPPNITVKPEKGPE